MGIAHRGRLNLMICMLNLSPILLFAKVIQFNADPLINSFIKNM